jgi:hypothetical protein
MRHLLFLLVFVLACGDDNGSASGTGACTFGAPQPSCFEYTDASADELDQDAMPRCITDHGTWADAECSRSNIIGGCRAQITSTTHGRFTLTTWFYTGGNVATAADVMAKCPNFGGTFVTP